jgi:hypothetical protein
VKLAWQLGIISVVQRTEQFDKQRFPTDDVYYPTQTRGCGW